MNNRFTKSLSCGTDVRNYYYMYMMNVRHVYGQIIRRNVLYQFDYSCAKVITRALASIPMFLFVSLASSMRHSYTYIAFQLQQSIGISIHEIPLFSTRYARRGDFRSTRPSTYIIMILHTRNYFLDGSLCAARD